jgi:TRAP-type C4-dicarboxylate transport system permease small subunit
VDTKSKGAGAFTRIEDVANSVFRWIAKACGWILVLMALMITMDIVLRELRTAGLIDFNWQFVSEWSAFLVILLVFAGLAYTLSVGGHISVTLVTDRLPLRARAALAAVMALISEVVLVYMVYRGFAWMSMSIKRDITSTSVIKTPMWIPNSFIVFGLGLFAVAVALFIVRQSLIVVHGEAARRDPPAQAEIEGL